MTMPAFDEYPDEEEEDDDDEDDLLTQQLAGMIVPTPGVCHVCGCTDDDPCEGTDGQPCHWGHADAVLGVPRIMKEPPMNDEQAPRAERALRVLEIFDPLTRVPPRFIPGSEVFRIARAALRREQLAALPVRKRVWWWANLRAVRTVRALFDA